MIESMPEPELDAGELLDAQPGPDELDADELEELDLNDSNDWEFEP